MTFLRQDQLKSTHLRSKAITCSYGVSLLLSDLSWLILYIKHCTDGIYLLVFAGG